MHYRAAALLSASPQSTDISARGDPAGAFGRLARRRERLDLCQCTAPTRALGTIDSKGWVDAQQAQPGCLASNATKETVGLRAPRRHQQPLGRALDGFPECCRALAEHIGDLLRRQHWKVRLPPKKRPHLILVLLDEKGAGDIGDASTGLDQRRSTETSRRSERCAHPLAPAEIDKWWPIIRSANTR